MLKIMHKGPEFIHSQTDGIGGVGHFKTPMRPLSAINEPLDEQDKGASS